MEKVINIDRTEFKTPQDALKDALSGFVTGGDFEHCQKVLIISLNDLDGAYDISYTRNDLDHVQTIALLEIFKNYISGEIGY